MSDQLRKYTEDKKMENSSQEVDLTFFIQNIIDEFHFPLTEMGIEIRLYVEQENKFYADLTLLRIVIFNIVDNAVRFIDKEKDKRWIEIHAGVDFGSCSISISDNGIGMERDNEQKIFQIFFKASETSRGHGLGLYVVNEILGKMKGSITVTSQLKEGTKFMVWLPNRVQ